MGITVGNAVGGATLTSFNNNGDTVVVFEGHFTSNPTPPSSVTYGGVAMTMLYSVVDSATSSFETSAWILTNEQGAPTGVNAVVVTQNDFSASQIFVGATAFSGVNQISPARTASTANSGSTTAATVTPIQAVNDLVVGSVYTFSSSVSAGFGVTQYATHTTATITGASGGIAGSGSGAALSWTLTGTVSGDNWVIGAAALIPAAITRPPLYNVLQKKSPLGHVENYPNLLGSTLKPATVLPMPLSSRNKDFPDAINRGPENTAFMLVTTFGSSAPAPPSTNLTRPPLLVNQQIKRPIGAPDVFPNLLVNTLKQAGTTSVGSFFASASAPAAKPLVQIDCYPNLSVTTLTAAATPKFIRLSDSAPRDRRLTQVDVYPNLMSSGLKPGAFSLTTSRLSDSAPYRKWPPGVDVYPNLLATTLIAAPTTLTRPPLFVNQQIKRPLSSVDVFPNLTATTLGLKTPSVVQHGASAPQRWIPPQVDVYPNLLGTTLAPSATAPKVLRQDASAPSRWIPPQVDVYPPLSTTTLNPVPAPLSASRADASAPYRKPPPAVDIYPNLLLTTLHPIPAPLSSGRLDSSAPYKWPKTQVDVYPNLLDTNLAQPFTTVRKQDSSAPFKFAPLTVDAYPNLLGLTLAPPSALPPGTQLSASAPIVWTPELRVDIFPNLIGLIGPTPPPPTPVFPLRFAGRYLTHAHLRVQQSRPCLYARLSTGQLRVSLSRAGYLA